MRSFAPRRWRCAVLGPVSLALVITATASAGGSSTIWLAGASSSISTRTSPWATRVATPHPVSAPAITAYPWSTDATGDSDPYGQSMRQCVSYVAWYLNSHGTPFGYSTQGPKGIGTFANASTWGAAALRAGFTVSTKPLVGSVAQWGVNEQSTWTWAGLSYTMSASDVGHVAVVTHVYADSSIDIAQYNMGGNRTFSAMSHVRAPRYIYVPLDSPRVP